MHARQGITLLNGICAFIATLVIIQLWLVAASLEALYSDEPNVLFPATIASAVLFVFNVLLILLGLAFDRRVRQPPI